MTGSSRVIVGFETSDDAGVYRLTDGIALIQTLDFITPIVDDPYVYGQIAVCNGLSDVYAMGGTPITALNIICFPTNKFTLDVLSKVLQGGADKLTEAGVQLLGGHSVEDEELKFGVSVTGVVHPDNVIRNRGMREGDFLVLTKPLGTGIISTAIKAGMTEEPHIAPYIASMNTLNEKAAAFMKEFPVHACTDVTGFGFIGHLSEMLGDDCFEIAVHADTVPLLPGAEEYASMGLIPGGMYRNRDFVGGRCIVEKSALRVKADIAFDPQTSGGLLVALPGDYAEHYVEVLRAAGVTWASIVGEVKKSKEPRIRLM